MSDTDDSEPSTSYSRRRKATRLRNLVSDDSDDEGFSQTGRHKKEDGTDGEDEEEGGAGDEEEEEGLEGGTHEGSCLTGRDDGCETGDSDSSSGPPGAETCAICLGRIRGEVGSPEVCDHIFCLICILEWARMNATCPQDRKSFTNVSVRECFDGPVVRKVSIKKEKEEQPFIPEENPTYCEVCRECDREERLLLCDGCDLAYHLECLDPPLAQVPVEEWFCPDCASAHVPAAVGVQQEAAATRQPREKRRGESKRGSGPEPQRQRQPRRIPRTRAAERVRQRIQHHRKQAKAAKRKRRKQKKRERIDTGEEEDKRPPIKRLAKFSLFVSGDDDIDAEHAEDDYATQILSGEPVGQEPIYRDPATRKAVAARLLHLNSFIPLPGYSGKTSTSIIDRVDTQTSQSEGDVLSSILQGQSIALTSSKKLTLTTDRKFIKQEGLEVELPESFGKENLVISEPLPSQNEDAKEKGEKDEEGKDKKMEGKDDKKREGENERRRDSVQEDDRRRERDGEDKRRRERNWEEDRRRERDGEEFRRRWRDGEDSRRDRWRGDYGRRGDRNGYDRRDYQKEGGRYGFPFPPHRRPQSGRYFGHEPYRNREGSRQHSSSQSPLEDKRRSPPRLSYQRPQGQSSYRRDRDRYQSSPPYKRKFDSYRDHKKGDQAPPPRYRDFEIGHRGFCRSNAGDRRDSYRYDDDYRRSSSNSRRSDGDFRRYDGDSRRFESDSRSDAESRHSEESLGRKRRSSGRNQEAESKHQNRSSGERGHRPSRRSKDRSRSRSPDSRSRSRSNSRSPSSHSRHSERKTKSKTHSQLEGNNESSKRETTTTEVINGTENSNKDVGASTQDGEKADSKKSKPEHRKDLFASKWTEVTNEQTCKEIELPRNPRGKLEMETSDHEDERDFIHTTVGSLKAAVLNTQIRYEREDLGKATSERIGNQEMTNSEDEHISLPPQSSDRKLHRHKSKKERKKEKKEAGSSTKQDLAHLFGDENHSEKRSQKLEYDCISDDDDEEEKLDLPQKEKVSKGKSEDKHRKKHTHKLKQLFSDDDDEPTTLSLPSPTKEKLEEAFDLYDESFFFSENRG